MGYENRNNKDLIKEIEALKKRVEEMELLRKECEDQKKELQSTCDELQQTKEQVVQSTKMTAIGMLAGGVAHEVQNPLAIIMDCIYYLERKKELDDDKKSEKIQTIKKAILRADRIISGLLKFSRISSLTLKPCNINNIIKLALRLSEKELALDNITIVEELDADIPSVIIDENQIEQVFVNIILNAVQAMPKGGELIFKTFKKTLEKPGGSIGRRETDVFKLGSTAVICEIEDKGTGIQQDYLDKIFVPFFTTKAHDGNIGLGLSITKSIVERHKGLISIESFGKKGTKVTILLPTVETPK